MSLKKVWEEGRLIRHEWAREEGGRQLFCLFTALAGDPDARPYTCSADLCPTWFAHLLPLMADEVTNEKFPSVVERLVKLEPHFAKLPSETEWRVRAICVREAMQHIAYSKELEVCERVAALCEKRGHGENVSNEEFAKAARAVCDQRSHASNTAAIRAAEWAAELAPVSVAEAALAAVRAGRMADRLADRLTDAILSELERECHK